MAAYAQTTGGPTIARYVAGRVLQSALILFLIVTVAFLLVRLVPGDPAQLILGPRATPGAVHELRVQLGIDRSVVDQYWTFLGRAARFDFGDSLHQSQPVSAVLGPRIWPSVWLALYATLLTVLGIVPLAILAATRRNRLADHVVRLLSTVSYATPAFLTGLILVLLFSIKLRVFPVAGYGDGLGGHVRALTLPALTLALATAPVMLRTLRAGIIETQGLDYVVAARARGLGRGRVMVKHVLRNSIIATVTVLGISIGTLLSTAVVVESVFSLPGLGSLLVASVGSRDYPVIEALVLVFGGAVVLANLATDLLYVVIDPRIRL